MVRVKKENIENNEEFKYDKNTILRSDLFSLRRDILDILLDDRDYTINEVHEILNKFYEGSVK